MSEPEYKKNLTAQIRDLELDDHFPKQVPYTIKAVISQLAGKISTVMGYSRLHVLSLFEGQIKSMIRLEVHLARKSKTTWAEIGNDLGITRQAAQEKFREPSKPTV